MSDRRRFWWRPSSPAPRAPRKRDRFKGIRFRLGAALAVALLPILILGAFQAQADFRDQTVDRSMALQLAVGRAAIATQVNLDNAAVLLDTLSPESLGVFCSPRLSSIAQRLDRYDALYRVDDKGQIVCGSQDRLPGDDESVDVSERQWFQRLVAGETTTIARGSRVMSDTPSLVLAVRMERPSGRFEGAMVAVIPLTALQPDVTDQALPDGTQAALTDADGRILVETDDTAFEVQGPDSITGWVERARRSSSNIFEADDSTGVHRVYAGSALAGRDVYVLLSAPAPGPLSWARLNPISALLLPLAAWITAFAAVMLVTEQIVIRWLEYLERISALYAKGRFSVRPVQALAAPAEIRVLAETLDEMAENLAQRDLMLTESLVEKEALMREIHHRVKNNLQIISSLLSMQQRAVGDGAARLALGDTRQRISALALIYRTLYQSENIRYADSKMFLTELVGQLVSASAGRGPVVSSRVEADSLMVDPDKLAPLALWLVEAVTNAQKHAFSERGGDLQVRFVVNGEQSMLEVQDDGPGPDMGDGMTTPGVGHTLMQAFAKQLRGSAEFVRGPQGGTISRMTFATPEATVPLDSDDGAGTLTAP